MPATVLLSTGDIARIVGAHPNTIMEWATRGVVEPANNRRGDGYPRFYSLMDAVGLVYGWAWKQAGAGLQLVRPIARAVAALTEEQLLGAIRAGRRVVVPWGPDRAVLAAAEPGEVPEALDLEGAYLRVKNYAAGLGQPAVLGRRPKNAKVGA